MTPDDTQDAISRVARATLGSGCREAVGVRVSPLAPLWPAGTGTGPTAVRSLRTNPSRDRSRQTWRPIPS